MEKVRRWTIYYYFLQGVAVLAWWGSLYVRPDLKRYFRLDGSLNSLEAFLLPDLVFLAAGSVAAAALLKSGNKYAVPILWLVTGAISYAAIYTLSFALRTDLGWWGVALMLPAMLWSGVFSVGVTIGNDMFRKAKPSSTNIILFKTYLQIVVVWSVILLIIPYFLVLLEDKLGIGRFEFSYQVPISVAVFIIVSFPGIRAAHTMSRIGKGTPLPLDHASELVIEGPYSYLRNPMAVSGIAQGLAVALYWGSLTVAMYAITGSLIWQLVFRPLEEDELRSRFGRRYEDYQKAVKCWVPRTRPYQIDGTADSSSSIDSPLGRI